MNEVDWPPARGMGGGEEEREKDVRMVEGGGDGCVRVDIVDRPYTTVIN